MYSIERIGKMISDIDMYSKKIKQFNLSLQNIQDDTIFYATSMAIFGILNRVIDLSEQIIIDNNFEMPQSYQEYFEILNKEGVIGKELAEKLKKLADSRNIFAHEYYNLERKEVLKMVKDVSYALDFVEAVKRRIKNEK